MPRKIIHLVLQVDVDHVHPAWYFTTQGGMALLNALDWTTARGNGMFRHNSISCIAAFEDGKEPAYMNSLVKEKIKKLIE